MSLAITVLRSIMRTPRWRWFRRRVLPGRNLSGRRSPWESRRWLIVLVAVFRFVRRLPARGCPWGFRLYGGSVLFVDNVRDRCSCRVLGSIRLGRGRRRFRFGRRSLWKRRGGRFIGDTWGRSERCRRSRCISHDLNVICRGKAEIRVNANEGPIRVRSVVHYKRRVLRKGHFLVGLACVVIEGFRFVDLRSLSVPSKFC